MIISTQIMLKVSTMLACLLIGNTTSFSSIYNIDSGSDSPTATPKQVATSYAFTSNMPTARESLKAVSAEIQRQRQENERELAAKNDKENAQNAYYHTTSEELSLIRQTVANEAGGESFVGQKAIAQCILDTCIQTEERPTSVLVPGQFAVQGAADITDSVKKAVDDVFIKGEKVTSENIRWFYAPARCISKWHEQQKFIFTIGGHRFFAPNNV